MNNIFKKSMTALALAMATYAIIATLAAIYLFFTT